MSEREVDSTMIVAGPVRYIKLGKGGEWEEVSLSRGELHFGHGEVPHELALAGDREAIKRSRVERGRDERAAGEDAREIIDFYHLGRDCLWVTFANERLWWTFADPEVTWLGPGEGHGKRFRKSIGGWRCCDVNGSIITMDKLSTKLTKVAAYRRTICAIESRDYLLRRINGVEEPLVARGSQAREALLGVVCDAIALLHQTDFETLVDVIFARSGWHRSSSIGGTQKIVDLVLEQPTTAERAAVQVKSTASQKTLDEYIQLIDDAGTFSRFFFVCHSPKGIVVAPPGRADIHVWCGKELATTALRLGLTDWIIERTS
jgi:hypothetical protein